MTVKKGNLSISSENIFPIIKKWVYSDHDIFVRELISNGCDAITKIKKLDMMGECQLSDGYKPQIKVVVNAEEKTLKFIDNGLGMTADEVEEYITQIAFSGATEFLEKYKDKTTEDDMIGHFGLGFYSAFMVADEVHIDSLSYKEGAAPVHWVSDGGTEYEMQDGDRTEVGSTMTLYLNDDSIEFANEYRMREVIEKYCSFMPVEIFLENENADADPEKESVRYFSRHCCRYTYQPHFYWGFVQAVLLGVFGRCFRTSQIRHQRNGNGPLPAKWWCRSPDRCDHRHHRYFRCYLRTCPL